MFNWHAIWDAKGRLNTHDLTVLSGHERTGIDISELYAELRLALTPSAESTVLEVGCAAGLLRAGLDCKYVGVDYSFEMCRKFATKFTEPVFQAQAASLPFPSDCFDICFSFSVFHYFDDFEYASRAIAEMSRVAKYRVFIGDLPLESHDRNHLTFETNQFPDWVITPGIGRSTRFNISKTLSRA